MSNDKTQEALEALNVLDTMAFARMDNTRGVWKDTIDTIRQALQPRESVDVEAIKDMVIADLIKATPHQPPQLSDENVRCIEWVVNHVIAKGYLSTPTINAKAIQTDLRIAHRLQSGKISSAMCEKFFDYIDDGTEESLVCDIFKAMSNQLIKECEK